VSIGDAHIRGSAEAKAIMIVYSDFQCPFCRRFTREVLPEIERRYLTTGRIALVFHHLPLPIHAQAMKAAVVAECAASQGKFWEMHDLIFGQANLDDQTLVALPQSVEIDRVRFDQCLLDEAVSARIKESANEAGRFGIRGTPAFFFGRRSKDGRVKVVGALSGARPAREFVAHLEEVLIGSSDWRRWIPFVG
jgi:protein-disulfide isomerase